ncbi:uncharacterized protein LOC105795835 [Gossypium raimondii]|uniref:uncharacterized protein LOC105795835 n=1 Tax=Gossypium raimondii TaxID=29730 RepID=UPI00063B0631|nr:uncharacterized protein LOC105795835 [Gossypium raimondii]
MVVDASANGTLLDKSYNKAYEILEKIANNTRVWTSEKAIGTMELDAITSLATHCPSNPASVCYMGARNSNNAARQNAISVPPGYNQLMSGQNVQQGQPSSSSPSIEDLWKEFMAKNDFVIESQVASLRALENQVGEIVNAINLRPQGALPSDTENFRSQGKEQCKAITLRSRTHLNGIIQDATVRENNSNKNRVKIPEPSEKHTVPEKCKQHNVTAESKRVANKNAIAKQDQQPEGRPPLHFPQLGEFEIVALTEGCTTMLVNKLPPNLKDPGNFTIPCSIGNRYIGNWELEKQDLLMLQLVDQSYAIWKAEV